MVQCVQCTVSAGDVARCIVGGVMVAVVILQSRWRVVNGAKFIECAQGAGVPKTRMYCLWRSSSDAKNEGHWRRG